MRKLVVILGAAALLGGCAIERARQAEAAQTAMIGMPRERVLACMGAPDSRADAGQTEVWTYHAALLQAIPRPDIARSML
jgi:hypothetical protein